MGKFTTAYIECALWSSTDDDGESLEREYQTENIAPETLASMAKDCEAFQRDEEALLTEYRGIGFDLEQAGHDFWLTRNGHGAGFWDRDYSAEGQRIGRALTGAAKVYGTFDLYIGDDGQVHGA